MAHETTLRKVKVEGGNLKFSAAHFITYGGKCERLHGHNYGVLVEMDGRQVFRAKDEIVEATPERLETLRRFREELKELLRAPQ